VVRLVSYLHDKDVFANYYQKKLSRRLLLDKSASEELENAVLSKLKTVSAV
jgi:hypothetical protein